MREKLSRMFDSRKFYLVLSVFLAVLYWLVLSLADDSEIETTIYDVPVQLDYNASAYQSFGLEIIGDEALTVDVTVTGQRNVLDGLTADDFLVYPNVNSVTTGGTKTLRLVYGTVNSTAKYSIARISQESVTLRFDKMVTQKFEVNLNREVSVQEGYMLDSCEAVQQDISISGPSEEVSTIAQVLVTMPDIAGQSLTESRTTRGEIHLLNADDEEVDRTLLVLDNEQVDVNINILRRIQQPLKLQFTNVPRGFDVSTLQPTLDREEIGVAVPTTYDQTQLDESYPVYINFFDLQNSGNLEEDCVVPLTTSEDFKLLDNVQQVTVHFNTEGYAQYRTRVTDIRIVNTPEGKKVEASTPALESVTLMGPPEEVEKLKALDEEGVLQEYISAQVDASKILNQSGEAMLAVQILIPSINSVFAVGSYTAVVNVGAA